MLDVPSNDRLETELPDAKPTYTKDAALVEASRCLYCYDAPCIRACPTAIDIPAFIKKIATGNLKGSAKTILEANILGYSCGRVCPVEVLCAGACVYNQWEKPPIEIGRLQRYATEWLLSASDAKLFLPKPKTGKKVALVGGGPASLACAAHLALEGHEAIILEKDGLPGGLNTTGVAPYKLHAEDSLHEVRFVLSLGATLKTGVEVGKVISGSELLKGHDAVFIGVGLGGDSKLNFPGEEGPGVVGATEWIRKMKLDPSYRLNGTQNAVVVGGGNTAIDVARELLLLKVPSVTMIYRRTRSEMSGYEHEMDSARLEGVRFLENAIPVAVERGLDGVKAVQLARCENGKPVKGSEWLIDADFVAVAIGQAKLHRLAALFPGVKCDEEGRFVVDPKTGRTGNPKVFAGGDCVNGGKEVVNAVAEGKRAAIAIHKLLMDPRP